MTALVLSFTGILNVMLQPLKLPKGAPYEIYLLVESARVVEELPADSPRRVKGLMTIDAIQQALDVSMWRDLRAQIRDAKPKIDRAASPELVELSVTLAMSAAPSRSERASHDRFRLVILRRASHGVLHVIQVPLADVERIAKAPDYKQKSPAHINWVWDVKDEELDEFHRYLSLGESWTQTLPIVDHGAWGMPAAWDTLSVSDVSTISIAPDASTDTVTSTEKFA